MKRFVEGEARDQISLLPECVEDYVGEDNPVRVIDVFVDELDLRALGFEGATPAVTGRPAYDPAVLLKIYIYGYLNRVQSSRRLERECQRNLELMWLTGRLAPDFKTIADFRRDNGRAIRRVCSQFVVLCRRSGLFSEAVVAIDGSKFKAVNHRDDNFTEHQLKVRIEHLEQASDSTCRARPCGSPEPSSTNSFGLNPVRRIAPRFELSDVGLQICKRLGVPVPLGYWARLADGTGPVDTGVHSLRGAVPRRAFAREAR